MSIEGFFCLKFKKFKLNTTFKFKQNEITCIIGESASGKSTFLKCLSGIIKAQTGFFRFNDKILHDSIKKKFILPNQRNIGHVLQTPVLFYHLSVLENLYLAYRKTKNIYFDLDYIVKNLYLHKLIFKNIINLSGGEKQRLLIGQTMLMQPKLILLDESLSSQDNFIKSRLIFFFKNINELYKIPIIYISHNIKDVELMSKNIFYMANGKLIN